MTERTQKLPPEVVDMLRDYRRLLEVQEKFIIELAGDMDPADTLADHYYAKMWQVDQVLAGKVIDDD